MAFLHQFFIVMAESHKTFQALIWDILLPCGDRVTSDTQEKLRTGGGVRKDLSCQKKCVEAGGEHERAQNDAYGTGGTQVHRLGGGASVIRTNTPPPLPTAWKGPLGGLLTNNLTGLKHVSHV